MAAVLAAVIATLAVVLAIVMFTGSHPLRGAGFVVGAVVALVVAVLARPR